MTETELGPPEGEPEEDDDWMVWAQAALATTGLIEVVNVGLGLFTAG